MSFIICPVCGEGNGMVQTVLFQCRCARERKIVGGQSQQFYLGDCDGPEPRPCGICAGCNITKITREAGSSRQKAWYPTPLTESCRSCGKPTQLAVLEGVHAKRDYRPICLPCTGRGILRLLERLLFVVVLIATLPLALLWLCIPVFGGVFLGLPIAAVKYILTGESGVDWYMGTVVEFFFMNWPVWLWGASISRRKWK